MRATEWTTKLENCIKQNGESLPGHTKETLRSELSDHPSEEQLGAYEIVKDAAFRSIFRHAAKGETFGPENKIEKRFGRTLKENYGVQNGPFLDVARAYWTFNMELSDLRSEVPGSVLLRALADSEQTFASVFFPTGGPAAGPPLSVRRQTQIQLLEEYAPEIDAQRYVAENPMLNEIGARFPIGRLVFFAAIAMGLWLVLR